MLGLNEMVVHWLLAALNRLIWAWSVDLAEGATCVGCDVWSGAASLRIWRIYVLKAVWLAATRERHHLLQIAVGARLVLLVTLILLSDYILRGQDVSDVESLSQRTTIDSWHSYFAEICGLSKDTLLPALSHRSLAWAFWFLTTCSIASCRRLLKRYTIHLGD